MASTSTRGAPAWTFRRRVASMPSSLGIRMSIKHHVRAQADRLRHRLGAVAGLVHDLYVLLGTEHGLQTVADQLMVVGQDHLDHGASSTGSRARTAKPPFASRPTSTVPP